MTSGNRKDITIRCLKVFIILVLPFILTMVVSVGNHKAYEFVDDNSRQMVAPAAPFPYLSKLFSDVFVGLGANWYKFCVENNSYSPDYHLPHDLAFKLDKESTYIKIHYQDTHCEVIKNNDTFYDVAWGGFVVPDKAWADKNFECDRESCSLNFKVDEIVNFDVYSKLTWEAIVGIYLLLVAAIFAVVRLCISVYIFIKKNTILPS